MYQDQYRSSCFPLGFLTVIYVYTCSCIPFKLFFPPNFVDVYEQYHEKTPLLEFAKYNIDNNKCFN